MSVLADHHEMKVIGGEFLNQFKVEIRVLVDQSTLRGMPIINWASDVLNLSQKTFFLYT